MWAACWERSSGHLAGSARVLNTPSTATANRPPQSLDPYGHSLVLTAVLRRRRCRDNRVQDRKDGPHHVHGGGIWLASLGGARS